MAMTSSAMRDLSDQNVVGTRLGTTSSDLIGFYGVTTCVARQTWATTAATLGSPGASQTASTGGFGASTAAIATSTFALVNALQADVATIYTVLKNYGFLP
jgi:hypothetical protein